MINFATIGSGWITDSFINSAKATGDWNLVAIYSRSEDTAKQFATKHGISHYHNSIESLAFDPTIQTVYIASPNSLHHSQAKILLDARKHVILEKPACSTSKELLELFKLAKEKKVFLLEAFRHIHETNFGILAQSLEKLGPIYGASLNYASYSSRYNNVLAGETPNIFSLNFSGGSLVDLGVYPISAAVALFGVPVSQSYKPVIVRTGADGGGLITLNYKNFGVSINASKIYSSTAPSEIYGEKGTLQMSGVTDIEYVQLWEAKSKRTERLGQQKAELSMFEEAQKFGRIITEEDWEAAERLQEISQITQGITEDLRKQNGLLFKVEKE